MKNRVSAWIILGVITIVAAFALAYTNEVTKDRIAQHAVVSEEKARAAVVPGAASFETVTLEDGQILYAAKDAQGAVIGYIGKSVRNGYASPIEVITGIDLDGNVTGVNVGGSAFAETPGLGAKTRETLFTAQFTGKSAPVKIGDSENPGEVDAVTAATISSSAVVASVNQVARRVDEYLNPKSNGQTNPSAEGTTYGASAEGFAGPVAVAVTVKDDGTVTALTIGDSQFNETDNYGAAALEPAFAQQFIGKTLPVSVSDIDAIAGATYTTNAVIEAINAAYAKASTSVTTEAPPAEIPVTEVPASDVPATEVETTDAPPIATAAPVEESQDVTAEAQGFIGPVAVTVSFNADGTIASLRIGDDRFAETPGYGALALDAAYADRFVGKLPPLTMVNIGETETQSSVIKIHDADTWTSATATTQAIIDAVNAAFTQKH